MTPGGEAFALAVEGIVKTFGGQRARALDDVSLGFAPGRIHAVVGENGAGKTTLLRIAAGLLAPDAGTVRAGRAGGAAVSMVQQHFGLVGALRGIDNIMLGAEPAGLFGRLDVPSARARAARIAADLGAPVDLDARVDSLGVGERQTLEIVRALARDAGVLILDEPTAVLTPAEASALYATLRRLASGGRAVIVVTHRLDEVREHADDVSVLRAGRLVSTGPLAARDDATIRALAHDAMNETNETAGEGVGEREPAARGVRALGEVRLELRDVARAPRLRSATLAVRGGEIVGIAGVDGNGQRELVRVVAGLEPPDSGTMRAGGAGGVAAVHEERGVEGLVLDASVRENLVLGELATFARFGVLDGRALDRAAAERRDRAGIVPLDLDLTPRALSGGNQQKIVVARALARALAPASGVTAIVFAQPTRGVDRRAALAIHDAIRGAADAGLAVLVVSADLGELRALCDRIAVMARGRLVAELSPDAPDERFAEAMLGGATRGTGT